MIMFFRLTCFSNNRSFAAPAETTFELGSKSTAQDKTNPSYLGNDATE